MNLTCKTCNAVGTINDHFTYRLKDGTVKPLPKCKKCHNAGQYEKKAKGFAKLPQDQQTRIKLALADRHVTIKTVADEEGIPYANLRNWVLKGFTN